MEKKNKNLEERMIKALPIVASLVTAVGSYIIFKDLKLMSNPIAYPLTSLGIGFLNFSLVSSMVYGLFEDGDF